MPIKSLLTLLLSTLILIGCETTDGGNDGPNGGTPVDRPDTETASREDSTSIDAGAFSEVLVETYNGQININGAADSTQIEVSANLHARGPTQSEAQQRSESIQLVAAADPNNPSRLHIRAEFPGGRAPVSHGANLTVDVPPTLKVIVSAANTSVTVRRINNEVEIRTNKGEATVTDISSSVLVRTTEQKITCYRVGGNVDLKTTDGRIDLRMFGGKVKLRNRDGAIEIYHDKPPTPIEVDAETSGSTITSELPGNIRADLALEAPNGSVDAEALETGNEIPLTNKVTSSEKYLCKMNGGGEGRVRLVANNGSIFYKVKEFTRPVGGGE